MPAPSPGTKPSRSRSNGRLAFSGASLRVESARMALNDAMPTSHSDASVPPASMTSASPCWIILDASPSVMVEAAQAVVTVVFGPRR